MADRSKLVMKQGQKSWRLRSDTVELFVTRRGGHVAPVLFDRKGAKIQPFAIAPWAEEKKTVADQPPIIRALRGDFFCMPFGGNTDEFEGEQHPVHGETANRKWTLEAIAEEDDGAVIHLSMDTRIRAGRVDKYLYLVAGHNAVYSQHVITGMSGPMNFGHHACLQFPDRPGAGRLSTSRRVHCQVYLDPTESPESGGYSILKPGAVFRRLDSVPTVTGRKANLSRYPARRGFEDIAILVNDPQDAFAWAAVAFPDEGYVWFSLKNPGILASTLLWMSNGGRHYPPWNSRHVNVLGVEDITGFFHCGLAQSARPNKLSGKGFRTCHTLTPDAPFTVNYIMAAVPAPKGFGEVSTILPADDRTGVVLTATNGTCLTVPVDLDFLNAASGHPPAG